MQELIEKEKMLEALLNKKNTAEAIKLLQELCLGYAKLKDFKKADAFRDKLFEVDPLALKQIITTAEAIEAEKKGAIDQEHMRIWNPLYRSLTVEETNGLYYTLESLTCSTETSLFSQGEQNNKLYFIDHGQLTLLYREGSHEHFLKKLGGGGYRRTGYLFSSFYLHNLPDDPIRGQVALSGTANLSKVDR